MAKRGLILLVLILNSLPGLAQDTPAFNPDRPGPDPVCRIFKINPFTMISGPIPVFSGAYGFIYESPVSSWQSIQAGISIVDKGPLLALYERYITPPPTGAGALVKGIFLQFAWKFYRQTLTRQAPRGWYLAPFFRFGSSGIGRAYAYSMKGEYLAFDNYDINLILGFQRVRRSYKRMVFDFYCGGGYKQYQAERYTSAGVYKTYSLKNNPWLNSPLNLCAGINIGWSFCNTNANNN
ncbi:MAG: hypothetical protein ACHQRM_03245 [Bacteroidia bacterium]